MTKEERKNYWKKRAKKHYAENKNECLEYAKTYREAHREQINEYQKNHYAENKEYHKDYYQKRKESIRDRDKKHYEKNKEYYIKWREDNKSEQDKYRKNWRDVNRDRISIYYMKKNLSKKFDIPKEELPEGLIIGKIAQLNYNKAIKGACS